MTEPQNEIIYQVAQHMKETADRLEKKLDDNTLLTQQVLIQATKTNGRVTAMEDKLKEYPKNVDKNNAKINWMMGTGAAIVVMVGVAYGLLLKNIKDTITIEVAQCCKSLIVK